MVPPLDIVEPGESGGSGAGLHYPFKAVFVCLNSYASLESCFMHKSGHFHGTDVSM